MSRAELARVTTRSPRFAFMNLRADGRGVQYTRAQYQRCARWPFASASHLAQDLAQLFEPARVTFAELQRASDFLRRAAWSLPLSVVSRTLAAIGPELQRRARNDRARELRARRKESEHLDLFLALAALDTIAVTLRTHDETKDAARRAFVARFAAETIDRMRSKPSRDFVALMAKVRDTG